MSADPHTRAVEGWLTALDERHLADLTLPEVTRALRALSSCYVERRGKLATGGALDGAGKRAAFALFYGPQHFFISREILQKLGRPQYAHIVDLGCGTGSAGGAAAFECTATFVEGFDLNAWAVREANWTYRVLGLNGRASVLDLSRSKVRTPARALILAAYSINELADPSRDAILARFIEQHRQGAGILVVEPIGRRVNRWWPAWADAFDKAGGREDDWRFAAALPLRQRVLAKGAGLDVQMMTARSLYLPRPE